MSYTVVAVDKEPSPGRTHQHIASVCTTEPRKYLREQVIASIRLGNTWYTRSPSGTTSKIVVVAGCSRCDLKPYIRTEADSTTSDNLLSLPSC
jgi:hypothetical protein